jgi:hypothetical protein
MTEPNQTFDRLREQNQKQFERQSEQVLQESSENLHRIATSGLEIWKGYLSFGTSVAQAWCDTLQNTRSSIEQMASSGQNQNQSQNQNQNQNRPR